MNEKNSQENAPLTDKGNGAQGVDKAPGEEPAEKNTNFTQETQKGKKVDADPELESDKPAAQELK